MQGYWEDPERTADRLRPGRWPWERVLATGDRTGHVEQPMPLDPDDDALVERLATFGQGTDPHTPGDDHP